LLKKEGRDNRRLCYNKSKFIIRTAWVGREREKVNGKHEDLWNK